jgi:hypothetical protein
VTTFERFNAPKVECFSHMQMVGMSAATTQSNAAD